VCPCPKGRARSPWRTTARVLWRAKASRSSHENCASWRGIEPIRMRSAGSRDGLRGYSPRTRSGLVRGYCEARAVAILRMNKARRPAPAEPVATFQADRRQSSGCHANRKGRPRLSGLQPAAKAARTAETNARQTLTGEGDRSTPKISNGKSTMSSRGCPARRTTTETPFRFWPASTTQPWRSCHKNSSSPTLTTFQPSSNCALRLPNVPAFSSQRQREREARPTSWTAATLVGRRLGPLESRDSGGRSKYGCRGYSGSGCQEVAPT